MYLKAGTGNACAGQNNVSGSADRSVYVREFSAIVNFGLELATGSEVEDF